VFDTLPGLPQLPLPGPLAATSPFAVAPPPPLPPHLLPPPPNHQGRLPEIDVLQKQISKAHEELSDLRFRLEEQRASSASKEKALCADKAALQSSLEATTHANERLQLEASNATARATKHEKQLEELYDLLNSTQGE
jgi:hypothetical protein